MPENTYALFSATPFTVIADYLILIVIYTIVISILPTVIIMYLTKRAEHKFNSKLEQTKAELQASYSTLQASVGFISAGQSELRSKVLKNVEILWGAVNEMKEGFSPLILMHTVLTPDEIARYVVLKERNTFTAGAFEFADDQFLLKKMNNVSGSKTENCRIFVGDKLWLLFFTIRQIYGRLAALLQFSFREGRYRDWKEDEAVFSWLRTVLPSEDVDAARGVGGPERIIVLLEAEFLREARRVISGSTWFADSLSDLQSILQSETQRISAEHKG